MSVKRKSRWKIYKCCMRDQRGRLFFVDELTTPHRVSVGDSVFLGGPRGLRDYFVVSVDGTDMIVDEVHG